ncbi:hypothetical protein EYF80_046547 [Liparis tanakae]|uniref:Uncharacterized protein n=1 Tax=Liparis tanakae TaxID=230148 RepID=A0A4Z2FPV1_9TELE|nr:hypothetical protein EYF80_046547 [Liparis tanakae]
MWSYPAPVHGVEDSLQRAEGRQSWAACGGGIWARVAPALPVTHDRSTDRTPTVLLPTVTLICRYESATVLVLGRKSNRVKRTSSISWRNFQKTRSNADTFQSANKENTTR